MLLLSFRLISFNPTPRVSICCLQQSTSSPLRLSSSSPPPPVLFLSMATLPSTAVTSLGVIACSPPTRCPPASTAPPLLDRTGTQPHSAALACVSQGLRVIPSRPWYVPFFFFFFFPSQSIFVVPTPEPSLPCRGVGAIPSPNPTKNATTLSRRITLHHSIKTSTCSAK